MLVIDGETPNCGYHIKSLIVCNRNRDGVGYRYLPIGKAVEYSVELLEL